jgi:hypothetical protein
MWYIRRIWPEYITIVLKLSLLTMAFSIRRACLGQLRKFSAIGILVSGDAIAQKTYTTFNPINLVEKGTRHTYYPRRKDSQTAKARSFQAAQLRGIKVDFIFPRRKPLGSETTKCPSLAKKSSSN